MKLSMSQNGQDRVTDLLLSLVFISSGTWLLALTPAPSLTTFPGQRMIVKSFDLGLFLVISGSAILLAAGFSNLYRRVPTFRGYRQILLLLVPLALMLFFVSDRVSATKSSLIAGERFFWLDDDMMISMRYAKNLAQGHGLTWNPGAPPVEGFTNFLWTLYLTLPHLANFPDRLTSAFVLGTNTVVFALILIVTERLGRRMGISPAVRWIALLLLASNRWMVHWVSAGSEVPLQGLFVLLIAVQMMRARRRRPFGLAGGLMLGVLGLVRADGMVLIIAFAPALCILLAWGRARWWSLMAVPLPLLAQLIFRLAYYGEWLPNTYYLKAVDFPMRVVAGVDYVDKFFGLWAGVYLLQILSLKFARPPVARWLALVPSFAVGYALWIGGDELPENRFFVPILPLMLLGAAATVDRIFIRRTSLATPAVPGRYGWLVAVLLIANFGVLCLPGALFDLQTGRGRTERGNVEIGLLIKANTEPHALVAHHWGGAAPYFSDRPAHDMLGKNDRVIARQPSHPGDFTPGHTKYDTAYSLGLRPDVVVSAWSESRLDPAVRATDPPRFRYPALYALYDDETFVNEYQSGLVPLPLSRDFHAVFVRRDSALARPPDQWRDREP